ncbi:class I glutamine amidotransferase-like protein [Periconia macrospinosa]|uniref:Class I glutamine amidotransferase-like protein n=1 Tax=Periconia macrospinosa TaxID=97972 RepID=A0A2V1E4G9_9PLEO|nr:class I glutamine amidotransferase-like protein [Periconia macrospinosa]
MAPRFNVAIILYPEADMIDFSGPTEIYSIGPLDFSPPPFKTTTFSSYSPVTCNSLTYVPDGNLSELEACLSEFDVLVVPGAHVVSIDKLLSTGEGRHLTQIIKKFSELPPRKEAGRRFLQSVCTGSLILAASDVLRGRTVTTHHMFYDALPLYADKAVGSDAAEGAAGVKVVKKRWVHAGKTEGNVEIVTAGGVSSGIDASLFVVELLAGKEAADWASEIVEFERRGEDEAWGVKK